MACRRTLLFLSRHIEIPSICESDVTIGIVMFMFNSMNTHKIMTETTVKTQRLTVSLAEDLAKATRRAAKERTMKVSSIVASALKQYLGMETLSEPPVRPTVLWKLKGRDRPAGPSPRMVRHRAGAWRVVPLDRIPV